MLTPRVAEIEAVAGGWRVGRATAGGGRDRVARGGGRRAGGGGGGGGGAGGGGGEAAEETRGRQAGEGERAAGSSSRAREVYM
jgi:hypothetical protein